MKKLNGTPWPFKPAAGLKKISDLIYFDGPLLTHFESPNGDDFLYYWVDSDDECNRWMVLRVDEASILRLANRVVPLDFVIPQRCRDEYVLFIDIDSQHATKSAQFVDRNQIPKEYLPKQGAYLPLAATENSARTYSVMLEGQWNLSDLGDFPNIYSKAYSLLYALNVLHVARMPTFPWRGGFSSFHFFKWAARKIPTEDRPSVKAMQYASPGFIRFALHGPTADQTALCISKYRFDNKVMAEIYGHLSAYIKEHKLNETPDSPDLDWERHRVPLSEGATKLLGAFGIVDAEAFVGACMRPFEAAKIASAFYRYVRTLADFEKRGLARFPSIGE